MPKIFIKEFGDAIIEVIRNGIPTLDIDGLDSDDIGWARGIIAEPGYILDPNIELPKVKLVFVNLTDELRTQAGLNCLYEFSLFYFRKQTKGEEHQQLILEDITKIFHLFSDNPSDWRPIEFALIGDPDQQQLQQVVPNEIRFYPELRHTIDLPDIRISVAEIRIQIASISWKVV